MAIFSKKIIGLAQGKVGNVVICNWKGKAYVRALPVQRKKGNVSAKMKASQSRFKLVQQHLIKILPYARIGFEGVSEAHTAYNSAMSFNLRHAIKEHANGIEMDWSKFSFSRGLEFKFHAVSCYYDVEEGNIHVEWQIPSAFIDDFKQLHLKCMLLCCPENVDYTACAGLLYGNAIEVGFQELSVDELHSGERYHVYLAFVSAMHKMTTTNSIYIGMIIR